MCDAADGARGQQVPVAQARHVLPLKALPTQVQREMPRVVYVGQNEHAFVTDLTSDAGAAGDAPAVGPLTGRGWCHRRPF